MSAPIELDPGPEAELDRLDKARRWDLLELLEDALDALGDNPGARENRRRAFPGGAFGITVRQRDDEWLIIWEHDGDLIRVRYIGPDPFA
jgi:plasmid stabilization system protein ParE